MFAKLALCRTAALGGHVYQCPQCQHRRPVYNSCLDRHCPQCRGGRRADWLASTAHLLLPKVTYFQVVWTVPELLWPVMLGNRRTTYRLLFHAAWQALRQVLRDQLRCEPAALMVLHTWNQRLGHFPHLHALVPGGGPSLDGPWWVQSRHRRHRRRRQPYLIDNALLSAHFRDRFLTGLARLHRAGKLKLQGPWSSLREPAPFSTWLKPLRDCAWVVYVQPPPTANTNPEHVLKYLARYLTGGPISDQRLIGHHDGKVTFSARGKDKPGGNQAEPYTLTGVEFTRRWALHILPKRFVKSRYFGGYSCRDRQGYLHRCGQLLRCEAPEAEPGKATPEDPLPGSIPTTTCPQCQTPMESISHVERPTWKDVFRGPDRPWWYHRLRHAMARGDHRWYRPPPER